jgi:CDP-diacylglycerol--glycerol-3-phosphate 3-phosphatidyltransferase
MKLFVNLLSIFRIAAAFLIVPLLLEQLFMDAFFVFTLAAVSDFVDGFLARQFKVVTKLGGVLDQIGDKFLTVNALVMIVMFLQIWQIIAPAIIMICRDLYVSGLREYLGTQKIEMPVAKDKFALAKVKTTMQLVAIAGIFLWIWGVNADWAADDMMHYLFLYSVIGMWIAAALSVTSATQYTVNFIKHTSKKK